MESLPPSRAFSRFGPRGAATFLLITSCIFIVAFIFLGIQHLGYPHEVEWYEGFMMEHAWRIHNGLDIYVRPTMSFVPALYQPLYYYVVSAAMCIAGETLLAGRIVSMAATLVSAVLLADLSWRYSRSSIVALATVGLYLAAYQLTAYCYTLVRLDAFLLLLIVLAVYVSIRFRGSHVSVLVAALFALAFFTKQQSVFFLPILSFMEWRKSKGSVAIFIVAAIAFVSGGMLYLNAVTHGWHWYYTFGVPAAKGKYFGWLRTLTIIPFFLLRYWGLGVVLACWLLLKRVSVGSAQQRWIEWSHSIEGSYFFLWLTALVQAGFHRGDQMSSTNILLPLVWTSSLAIPYIVWRLIMLGENRTLLQAALAIQLLVFMYDPRSEPLGVPHQLDRERSNLFLREIGEIDGEVWLPQHSFVSRPAKASYVFKHGALDLLEMKDAISNAFERERDSVLKSHYFAAIIEDSSLFSRIDSIPGYTLAGRIGNPYMTRIGATPTLPTFLFLPTSQ